MNAQGINCYNRELDFAESDAQLINSLHQYCGEEKARTKGTCG